MRGLTDITTLAVGIALSVTGCSSQNLTREEVPPCIKQVIEQMQAENVRNPPGSVWQYQYNGQTVYYIPAYCCDLPSQLLDSACNLICSPDGGYTGAGDGRCVDFFERRQNEKLIWQDSRK